MRLNSPLRGGALAALALLVVPPSMAAQQRVELTIAATTDVHGRLRAWDYAAAAPDTLRGLARAATVVDSLRRAASGRVILVDAGDLLQGNAMTYVAGRLDSLAPSPVIAAMNAMRYDAAAIGNHEYNYGVDHLDRAIAQARFPFLAANARRVDGHAQYPGRVLLTRAGVKVAVIGITNPGAMVWDRDHLRGRVEIDDIVAALPEQIRAARAEGADAVVVVAHAGLGEVSSYDTVGTGMPSENPMARVAREVPGIDLIVIGHSHQEIADTLIHGVRVIQPRQWAGSVAVATLVFERAGAAWRVTASRGAVVPTRGHPERRDVVAAVARAHEAAVRYSAARIGATASIWSSDSARITDTPIIDLIQEVQRKVSGAELSVTSAFTLTARFDPGPITVEKVLPLYPYENTLRALRLSGAQIRAFLEHSARYWVVQRASDGSLHVAANPQIPGYNYDMLAGLDYTIDLSRPAGSRITALEKQGVPVADSDTFTVAFNSYRATGGGGYDMLRGAPVVYEGTEEVRTLIVEEIQRRGAIEPADVFTRNWRLLPPARTLRVLGMNDFHGALIKRPDANAGNRGGAAELAAVVRAARVECAPVCTIILLNGGDLFQGTPVSNFAFGAPTAQALDLIGVDAHALGNHEFDWGQDTLRARMRDLRAPILGANVTYADGTNVPWIPDDTLLVRDGVRIGVIGIADPATPRTTMARHVADLRFVDPAPVVRARAAALRARGAEVVLVVAHLGGFCDRNNPDDCRGEIFDMARALGPGVVDAIVSGHTHSEVRTVVAGTPIVQARVSARALGIIDLPLGAPVEGAAPRRPEVRPVVSDSVTPDSTVAALVARAFARVEAQIMEPIVTTDVAWPREGEQYALGNLIADAQRAAGRGDIAVMNNGGIRVALRPGTIRWWDLFEVQPFANRLMVATVTGAELRTYLEGLVARSTVSWHISGATVDYDPTAPARQRLRRVVFADGAVLSDTKRYRVVLSDFLAGGGEGVSLGSSSPFEDIGIVDLDALVDMLRAMPNGRLEQTDALKTPRFRARR